MRTRPDSAAPVAEIRAESQLFATFTPVCGHLVTLVGISNRDHILEPSAGTGAILWAIRDTAPVAMCDAVEISSGLIRYLRENFNGVGVQCGDLTERQPVQYHSRVIMNPSLSHGQDIRHILRVFSLLRPSGMLVVVCLNGLHQQEKLLPFSDTREKLPRGISAYADVPTVITRLRARRFRTGGRVSVRLPALGKDRALVALKGTALTRRPFRYAEILLWAFVFPDLSFVCYRRCSCYHYCFSLFCCSDCCLSCSSPACASPGCLPDGVGCREQNQRGCLRPGGPPSLTQNPWLTATVPVTRLYRAVTCAPGTPAKGRRDIRHNTVS